MTKATPEELKEINSNWQKACNTPVMKFSSDPDATDMAFTARKIVLNKVHNLALSKGCDPKERWGIHLETGEFIAVV